MLLCIRAPVKITHNVKATVKRASSAITLQYSMPQVRRTITSNHRTRNPCAHSQPSTKRPQMLSTFQSPSQSRPSSTQPSHQNTTTTTTSSSTSQIPTPDPTAPHTTLATFLAHASHTNLSPTSTLYLGTRYEYLTQLHLQTHLGFHLTRVGGRGDSGIDHLGTWGLPSTIQAQTHKSTSTSTSSPPPIPVLLQCKRLTRTAGPNLIRELEGSFRGAPGLWRGEPTLGVMVCTRPATKGVRDAMGQSSRGLMWIMLEEVDGRRQGGIVDDGRRDGDGDGDGDGDVDVRSSSTEERTTIRDDGMGTGRYHRVPETRVRQVLYNAAAAFKCGLEDVSVGLKYDGTGIEKEAQLLWQGRPIDFTLRCATK